MYIAYILLIDLFYVTPLLILCFGQKGGEHYFVLTLTPLLMIDKKGEKYFRYMHVLRNYVYAYMFCVLQIGEKEFDVFHVYLHAFASVFMSLHCILIMFLPMHELRGSFLEALL